MPGFTVCNGCHNSWDIGDRSADLHQQSRACSTLWRAELLFGLSAHINYPKDEEVLLICGFGIDVYGLR